MVMVNVAQKPIDRLAVGVVLSFGGLLLMSNAVPITQLGTNQILIGFLSFLIGSWFVLSEIRK